MNAKSIIQQLNEMPLLVKKDWYKKDSDGRRLEYVPEYISNSTLERNYKSHIESKILGADITFAVSVTGLTAIASIKEQSPWDPNHNNKIVSSIYLDDDASSITDKCKHAIKSKFNKDCSKISYVDTDQDFEGHGLAGILYILTAKVTNNVILSDNIQFLGGHLLWKKLARTANVNNYVVNVINSHTGEFISDVNGEPINYDSTNIQDSEIWSEASNQRFSKRHILLLINTR
jgi:hypothetical protein